MADNPPIDPVEPRLYSRSRDDSNSEETLAVDQAQCAASSPETAQNEDDDIPPNGGYGWVCVACNFFINAHTWGVNSSYGVFLSYYLSTSHFPATSPLAYAFIGGLSISQALFIAPLATHVIHVVGTKTCLHLGVFFQTLSLIGASFARQKYQIILAQGLCFGWGMGFLFVGSVGIIPQWFTTRRSLANAVAAAGSGLGGLIYSLAAQRMIVSLGLAWSFRILGIVTFVVNLTASNLLRDRNSQVGARHTAFDTSLLRRPEFLLLQAWCFFSMLGYVSVLFSLPTYATAIGLSASQGSVVGALLNLGQMLGRPVIGLASDRYGRINLAAGLTMLMGVLCVIFWIPAELPSSLEGKMGLLTVFALVGGSLAGTLWATAPAVAAEVVGLRDLPAALSLTWVLMVPPTTFAEPIALEIRRVDVTRWKFVYAQVFITVAYVAAGVSLWVVRGWRVGEVEVHEEERRRKGMLEDQPSIDKETVKEEDNEVVKRDAWQPRDLARRMWARKVV